MSDKIIHVKAYTKDDGTHVKEHYRGAPPHGLVTGEIPDSYNDSEIPPMTDCTTVPDDGNHPLGDCTAPPYDHPTMEIVVNPLDELFDNIFDKKDKSSNYVMNAVSTGTTSSLVLEGGISTGTFDFSNIWAAIGTIAVIAVKVGVEAVKVAAELSKAAKTSNSNKITELKPQLNNQIVKIKETQKLSDSLEKMNVEKLTNTKKQEEYSNLYKTLLRQKQFNEKNKQAVARIEYAAQNNDYETVVDELNSFQNNYKEISSANSASSPMPSPYLNSQTSPDWTTEARAQAVKNFEQFKRTGLHDHPDWEKLAIDLGMYKVANIDKAYDAKELWKVAVYDFERSGQYIGKNGYKVNSTSELTPELKSFVSNKLQSQIGVSDSKGIIFKPDSTLSKAIIDSTEFQRFVQNNVTKMLSGQVVNGSINFDVTKSTHYALGHTDIIDAYIDAEGNLRAKVIDTYDFNKNDPDWKVEWAWNVQEHGLLTNFFTINIIVIPAQEWIKLLNII